MKARRDESNAARLALALLWQAGAALIGLALLIKNGMAGALIGWILWSLGPMLRPGPPRAPPVNPALRELRRRADLAANIPRNRKGRAR